MRSSPTVEEKVQKHLAEAARLLRGPMLNAPDWAMDIEATAHAIENDFKETHDWNAAHRAKIKIVKSRIEKLSSEYNVKLESIEIDNVIESVITDNNDISDEDFTALKDLDKTILEYMIQEIKDRHALPV